MDKKAHLAPLVADGGPLVTYGLSVGLLLLLVPLVVDGLAAPQAVPASLPPPPSVTDGMPSSMITLTLQSTAT